MPTNKRERQRENRAKKLEAQKKLERQQKLRKRTIRLAAVAVIAGGLLVIPGLFGEDGEDTTTTTTTTTTATTTTTTSTTTTTPPTTTDSATLPRDYEGFRAQTTACGALPPPPRTEMEFDAPVDQEIPAGATVTATITTSCGDIVAELNPALAPETVNSFVFLARQGYFDGTALHRIVPGFVIQAGDPTATGAGGPGYLVPDEFPEVGFTYGRGVLAMANSGADSTGSQFFIVTAEDAGLPNRYSAFGEVVDSDAALDQILAVPLIGRDGTTNGEQSLPLETVYIESVEVVIGA